MGASKEYPSLPPFAARTASLGSLLVFGLETDDSVAGRRDAEERLAAQLALLRQNVASLVAPASSFGQRLLRDAQFFHHMLDEEEGSVCSVTLASKLLGVGYRHVTLRRAEGGGTGSECFHNLRHSFLVVQGEGVDEGIDFIVEPNFREHFEISNPTRRYSGLLEMVPALLVASAAQLRPLVQLLFSEMSLAFEQQGLSLPPWRQSKSLLSKWLPSKARDLDLSPYASPRAASPESDFFALALGSATLQLPPAAADPADTSGTLTPGYSMGLDDCSPRAVLSGASSALSGHSAAQPAAQQPAGGGQASAGLAAAAALKPRSLLSTSRPRPRPRPAPAPAAQQPSLHVGKTGLVYTVAPAWQEPPIRTVRMQGARTPQQPQSQQ